MASIVATSLSNMVIGGPYQIRGAQRFQALHSSPLCAERAYDIDHAPGYSGGTGGSILMQLFPEVNGRPASNPISSAVKVADPQYPDPASGKGRFPLMCFTPQVTLQKGAWYWVIISDNDPSPKINFFSMDMLTGPPNQVPTCSIWQNIGYWREIDYLIPSPLVFFYSNGLWQGLGWIAAPQGVLECGSEYGFPPASCNGAVHAVTHHRERDESTIQNL